MPKLEWLSLWITTALVISSPALAQDHPALERGFSPEGSYDFSNLDSVAHMNGSLGLRIPIHEIPLAARGRSQFFGTAYRYIDIFHYKQGLRPTQRGINNRNPNRRQMPL